MDQKTETRAETGTVDLLTLWRRCATAPRERDWEELVARLDARLRRLGRRHLRRMGDGLPRREDIEELQQDVYCRLLVNDRRALRCCRASCAGELWSYLDRVCASVAVDRTRSRQALKRRPAVLEREPSEAADCATRVADPEWCPDGRLRWARARERIFATCLAIAAAPDLAVRNAFIVESVVFEGRSIDEVATRVGMRKSGVNSVLSRLRRRLRGGLEGAPAPRSGGVLAAAGERPDRVSHDLR